MTECSIYDATCQKERTDITYKKQRKVYKDKSIRVRFMIRNPLLTDISISNLRLSCRYIDKQGGPAGEEEEKDEEVKKAGFRIEKRDLKLPSKKEIEVILKVVPHRTGEILIEKI